MMHVPFYFWSSEQHKNTRKQKDRHHATYLIVNSAGSETNMVQVEAVYKAVLNMGIMAEAPMKGCPRVFDLALVAGPFRVCWKHESSAKKEVLPFSAAP